MLRGNAVEVKRMTDQAEGAKAAIVGGDAQSRRRFTTFWILLLARLQYQQDMHITEMEPEVWEAASVTTDWRT